MKISTINSKVHLNLAIASKINILGGINQAPLEDPLSTSIQEFVSNERRVARIAFLLAEILSSIILTLQHDASFDYRICRVIA